VCRYGFVNIHCSHVGRKLKLYHATLKRTPPETPETEDPNAVYRIKIHSAILEILTKMYGNVAKFFYRKSLNFVYIKRRTGRIAPATIFDFQALITPERKQL